MHNYTDPWYIYLEAVRIYVFMTKKDILSKLPLDTDERSLNIPKLAQWLDRSHFKPEISLIHSANLQ